LRIVIYDPSGRGGIGHYTYQLAQSLALMGSDVTVVTNENYELKHLPRNFNITVLFKKSWIKGWARGLIAPLRKRSSDYYNTSALQGGPQTDKKIPTLGFLRSLRLRIIWLKAAFLFIWKRPHLIHFQWVVDHNQEWFFIKLLQLLHFKIVYTVHDIFPLESDAHLDYEALKTTYRKVDALIVHAENTKKEFVSAFDVDPAKVYVIPHGSNDLFYKEQMIPKEVARERLNLSQGKQVILFFGAIKRYKGLEYLVEAFRQVKERVDNVVLLIAGKIYDKHAKDFEYYARLIDELRSHDDVICVADYIPFETIGCYFSAADMVVLPYTKTYTSGVLLAAYAAGRPVVVTDTGALREVVEPGKSGVIVPPKDSRALARAIIHIFKSSDIEAMGRYAKHLAQTRYSWETVASKTTDLYQSLVSQSNVKPCSRI